MNEHIVFTLKVRLQDVNTGLSVMKSNRSQLQGEIDEIEQSIAKWESVRGELIHFLECNGEDPGILPEDYVRICQNDELS